MSSTNRSSRKRPAPSDGPVDNLPHTNKRAKESHPTQAPVIDAASFPHIMEAIFSYAPYKSLLALRGASKHYRDLVDKRLAQHVVLSAGKEPLISGVPMGAFGGDGGESGQQALLPLARVLDVEAPNDYASRISCAGWAANIEVLRFRMQHCNIRQNLHRWPELRPAVIVYTADAIDSSEAGWGGSKYVSVPELVFFRDASKVVINLPWSRSTRYQCSKDVFETPQDLVVHFTPTFSMSSPKAPDNVRPFTIAYVRQLWRLKASPRHGGGDHLRKCLTLVDPPDIDTIYGSAMEVAMKTRITCTMSLLQSELANTREGVTFTSYEVSVITANVKILSQEEYKESVSREQYLLETRVRASDAL